MFSVSDLIDFESGTMNERESIELFSDLIKTGMAWQLQGFYGRTARDLINQNIISKDGQILQYPEGRE